MDCATEIPINRPLGKLQSGIDAPSEANGSEDAADRIARLALGRDALGLLDLVIGQVFTGRIAVVSSFGAESAVILALVAEIDRAVPVIFLDTGKHFPETLRYRDTLVGRLGLTDVRSIEPGSLEVGAADPDGTLHARAPDLCCALRKVRPLTRALEEFDAWITGRKRFHGATRHALARVEASDGRIKINPLADWPLEDVAKAFAARDLPHHPLSVQGYLSVGCAPCTRPSDPVEGLRGGRWSGSDKTECGIHWDEGIARRSVRS